MLIIHPPPLTHVYIQNNNSCCPCVSSDPGEVVLQKKALENYEQVYLVFPTSDGIYYHTITFTLCKARKRGSAALLCTELTEQQKGLRGFSRFTTVYGIDLDTEVTLNFAKAVARHSTCLIICGQGGAELLAKRSLLLL